MCTYYTEQVPLTGSSAKGGDRWFRPAEAVVYYDHPVHAMAEHSLNIDLADPADPAGRRVAVELSEQSARALIAAIERALTLAT